MNIIRRVKTFFCKAGPIQKEVINIPGKKYRILLLQAEKALRSAPNCETTEFFKTEHSFSDGMYTRKTTIPKGYMFLTFIHKKSHSAVHVGDVTMIEPTGERRVTGVHNFITPAGTQRICYANEESYCITTHLNPDNERDIDKIEKFLYALHYNELLSDKELDSELDILIKDTNKEALCQE